MISNLRSRITFANVTSVIALSVALGGTSYAALKLPSGSVGAKQLRSNAVTSPKVKAGSLLLSDFKRSQRDQLRGAQGVAGLAGPQGQAGPMGQTGATGAAGATNVVVRYGLDVSIPTLNTQTLSATCQAGERAVGGGAGPLTAQTNDLARIVYSVPAAGGATASPGEVPNGWNTRVFNGAAIAQSASARVVCASP